MSGASRQLLRRGLSARRARSPFAFGFIIASLLVVAVFLALRVPDTREFAARGGVLDLRSYDLDHRPAVDFGGEWAFFWEKGEKHMVRLDTGETVEIRKISDFERQDRLHLDEPEQKKSKKKPKEEPEEDFPNEQESPLLDGEEPM